MNGLLAGWYYAFNTGSDDYTYSVSWSLAPTNTMIELSLAGFYEYDDQSHAEIGVVHVEYLDGYGVTRHNDYGDTLSAPKALWINNLTRADWDITVSNCLADNLVNFFLF